MSKLYDKYEIKKVDGETNPNAQYFVLRIDTDRHARVALAAYAESIKGEDPEFSAELAHWLKEELYILETNE